MVLRDFQYLIENPGATFFLLFSVAHRMVMEEGGQRVTGRRMAATTVAEGRQVFVELGK